MYTTLVILERCRSGHNEAVLKTVSPTGHMGSNPILSAKREARKYANNGLHACFFYARRAEKSAATDGKTAKIRNSCNTNATQEMPAMQHDSRTARFAAHAVSPMTDVHDSVLPAKKSAYPSQKTARIRAFSIAFNQSHRKFSCQISPA